MSLLSTGKAYSIMGTSSNRILHQQDDFDDVASQEIEFLLQQKANLEKSFSNWIKCYTLFNVVMLVYSVLVMVYWLYVIYRIDANQIACQNLKEVIIIIVVAYILGIFAHIISLISAYLGSFLGVTVYLIALIGVFFIRVIFDVQMLDLTMRNLNGCTQQNISTNFQETIASSVIYLTLILLLISYAVVLLKKISKMKRAKRMHKEYLYKNKKSISGLI